jgi:CheY-like chemotaxis protein
LKQVTFLVVDDNELDVEKVEKGFARLKISNPLVRAKDGFEALEVLRGSATVPKLAKPYVILLDVNMPRMNGIEFLRELRADPALADSAVVVLTTSDRVQDVEAAYENQVAGYIVKPISRDDMLAALSKLDAYWNLCALPAGE